MDYKIKREEPPKAPSEQIHSADNIKNQQEQKKKQKRKKGKKGRLLSFMTKAKQTVKAAKTAIAAMKATQWIAILLAIVAFITTIVTAISSLFSDEKALVILQSEKTDCVVDASSLLQTDSLLLADTYLGQTVAVLKAYGLGEKQVLGICINFSYEGALHVTDDETGKTYYYFTPYSTEGDDCTHSEYYDGLWDNDSLYEQREPNGLGIAQWSNSRHDELIDFARGFGQQWYELDVQLAFLVKELNEREPSYKTATASSDVKDCVEWWVRNFEKPADIEGAVDTRTDQESERYDYMQAKVSAFYHDSIYDSYAQAILTKAGTEASTFRSTDCIVSDAIATGLVITAGSYALPTRDLGVDAYNNNWQLDKYRSAIMRVDSDRSTNLMSNAEACATYISVVMYMSGITEGFNPTASAGDLYTYYSTASGVWDDVTQDIINGGSLQSGDILCIPKSHRLGADHSHVEMYVAPDLLKAVVADYNGTTIKEGSFCLAASYHSYMPAAKKGAAYINDTYGNASSPEDIKTKLYGYNGNNFGYSVFRLKQ